MGDEEGHRPVRGPGIQEQYHPHEDGVSDDVQPSEEPRKCEEQERPHRRRFRFRKDKVLAEAQPSPVPQFLRRNRSERLLLDRTIVISP